MLVGFWSINGVGMGHTARVAIIAKSVIELGHEVAFLCESKSQIEFIEGRLPGAPVALARRPWRSDDAEADLFVATRFARQAHILVIDQGTVPEAAVLSPVVGTTGCPVAFVVRWLAPEHWEERVLRRLASYPDMRFRAIAAFPRTFAPHRRTAYADPPQLIFPSGFVVASGGSPSESSGTPRIAFTCGAGGTHSQRGQRELEEALLGVAQACAGPRARKYRADAWVGSNARLVEFAAEMGCFAAVRTFSVSESPRWGDYAVVVGRPSFNTLFEVLDSGATFVTGEFESDQEWTSVLLSKLARRYELINAGVPTAPTIAAAVTRAIVRRERSARGIPSVRPPIATAEVARSIIEMRSTTNGCTC